MEWHWSYSVALGLAGWVLSWLTGRLLANVAWDSYEQGLREKKDPRVPPVIWHPAIMFIGGPITALFWWCQLSAVEESLLTPQERQARAEALNESGFDML